MSLEHRFAQLEGMVKQQAKTSQVQSLVQDDKKKAKTAVKYGLAADKDGKPIAGAPAKPSPQPFVRGEK